MSYIPQVMEMFARLMSYPDQHTSQAAEMLFIILQGQIPQAAGETAKFGEFLEQHDARDIEEAYTSVFDVNPTCALEVGWHLFGEEYARGMFLVRMREELRKYDLPESAELPDHLSHVLAVVAAMPDEESGKLVQACLQPAVEKMRDALLKIDSPYQHVMSALADVLSKRWGDRVTTPQEDILHSRSTEVDPLHAFPVADVGCESGGCGSCGDPNLVTLESSLPTGENTIQDSSGKHAEERP